MAKQPNIPALGGPTQEIMVREFMAKHSYPMDKVLSLALPTDQDGVLLFLFNQFIDVRRNFSKAMAQLSDGAITDHRVWRLLLAFEELLELATALGKRDLVLAADAVADIHYVNQGTAIAFGLPLDPLFCEVHRSNMTKPVGGMKPDKPKGIFSEPNIRGVLKNKGVIR